MLENKESTRFLTHKLRSILVVVAISAVLSFASFSVYDYASATRDNDDNRELDIRCETGREDACLISACMGQPCVWYHNNNSNIQSDFDVSVTKYTFPSLDSSDDGCLVSSTNIQSISTSRMDDGEDDDNDDDDSVFTKLQDNDYDTKWEEEGFGSFIQADLGSVETVCNVGIAWEDGDERSYNFVISTSRDGITFTDVLRGTSSGSSDAIETYDLTDAESKFIRITVFGNNDGDNDDDTAAINELRIGTSADPVAQELSERSSHSNNDTELSKSDDVTPELSKSDDVTPDSYISELTDLMANEGLQERIQKQKQFTETNLPPSAEDMNVKASSVSSLEIKLKATDVNSDNELEYTVIDLPDHGVLKAGINQDSVLYYPNPGYVGSDSFTYRAINNHGQESALGTVEIDIEP
jgi:hypothetical protein